MAKIKSVLFVCTGNSCRSVMAEGLLKKYLKELGKTDIEVRSSGVRALTGLAPADATIEVLSKEGADVSGYRSQDLTNDLIKTSDLILVMEELHKKEVLRRMPEASSKTYLLKEFGRSNKDKYPEGIDVPDPIGMPISEYRGYMNIIKEEIERVAGLL